MAANQTKFIATEAPDLVRDTHSKGLLLTDREKLGKSRAARAKARATTNELSTLKKELDELRPKLRELEQLKEDIAKIKEAICLKTGLITGL